MPAKSHEYAADRIVSFNSIFLRCGVFAQFFRELHDELQYSQDWKGAKGLSCGHSDSRALSEKSVPSMVEQSSGSQQRAKTRVDILWLFIRFSPSEQAAMIIS